MCQFMGYRHSDPFRIIRKEATAYLHYLTICLSDKIRAQGSVAKIGGSQR